MYPLEKKIQNVTLPFFAISIKKIYTYLYIQFTERRIYEVSAKAASKRELHGWKMHGKEKAMMGNKKTIDEWTRKRRPQAKEKRTKAASKRRNWTQMNGSKRMMGKEKDGI